MGKGGRIVFCWIELQRPTAVGRGEGVRIVANMEVLKAIKKKIPPWRKKLNHRELVHKWKNQKKKKKIKKLKSSGP